MMFSQLFELRLSLSKQLDVTIRHHVFGSSGKKMFAVTGVLLQEKAKLLYDRLFRMLQHLFSASVGFGSQFTKSKLAEQSLKCCSTLYYSVAIYI